MGLRVEMSLGFDVGLFNTGVDASRTTLLDGVSDSHWMITSAPGAIVGGAPFAVPTSAPGAWLGANTTSTWIAPTTNTNDLGGNYTYQTSFDLTGLDPSTFTIDGQFSVDDGLSDILLNGQSTGVNGAGFGGWTAFSLNSLSGNGFNSGANTLEFLVNNGGNNPTGLRVEFLDVNGTLIPEPSGAILLALGGALLLRRRRN